MDTIDDFDVSETAIRNICKYLKKKTNAPDGKSLLYRECATTIAKSLSLLFYKLKQTATLPTIWEQSFVSPMYKKGKNSDI